MDDLAHARALCDRLGELFCLTYIKGVDAAGALSRLGGCPDTVRQVTASPADGHPEVAFALDLGAWSVVIEPGGRLGADHRLLEAASRGTAVVSVLRDDRAAGHFGYAFDGTTITAFDPGYPAPETTWGADPAMLRRLMDALGLRPPADESERSWRGADARAIVLAQRITGVRLPDHPLSDARLAAELEPWFVTPATAGPLLRAARRTPSAAALVKAAKAADPARQRTVALAEVRRQATVLGLEDSPGLAEALASGGPVSADSPLGRQIRHWLAESRRAAPGDGSRSAPGLGWFLGSLRGVLDPDPEVALLAALGPLASDPSGLADEQARAAVLAALDDPAR